MNIAVLISTEIEDTGIGYYDRKIFEVLDELNNKNQGINNIGISVGKSSSEDALREGLARNLNRGVLLVDDNYDNSNYYTVAKTLTEYLKVNNEFDIIMCGYKSHSCGTSIVPILISEYLNIPAILDVVEVTFEPGNNVICKATHDGITEIIKSHTPCIICCENNKAKILPTRLKSAMNAFNKEIKIERIEIQNEEYPLGNIVAEFKPRRTRKNCIYTQSEMQNFINLMVRLFK
ncbi:MAG: hypothetical protein RR495_07545 [Anaerovoracaceae bacterium]